MSGDEKGSNDIEVDSFKLKPVKKKSGYDWSRLRCHEMFDWNKEDWGYAGKRWIILSQKKERELQENMEDLWDLLRSDWMAYRELNNNFSEGQEEEEEEEARKQIVNCV